MKRIPLLLAALIVAPFSLVGCGTDFYSNAVLYGVRNDPLVLDDKLGDERYDPDRPGVFPLLLAKDLDDPNNPLYEKNQKDNLFKGELLRDPTRMSAKDRDDLEKVLRAYFGKPSEPRVGGIDEATKATLQIDEATLLKGSHYYRLNCLHCHGVPGDGRGPTGRWLNPHPRDYRLGLFKFMSVDQTDNQRPPRRADLFQTLQNGIDGTAMPSFNMLSDKDLNYLVSYVIHLSLRGKVEFEVIKSAFDLEENGNLKKKSDADFETAVSQLVTIYAKGWVESQNMPIVVSPYPIADFDDETRAMTPALKNSIQRGWKLFLAEGAEKAGDDMPALEEAKKADCVSCHVDYGRQAKFKYDSWGTLTRPQNLTQTIRRGGNRPIDIYYRIHSGISGSGMVAKGKTLQPESIWDLVNFVQTLPYPAMRKAAGIQID